VAWGVGVALVGVFVAACFAEDNFTPVRGPRWSASAVILRRGVTLARGDHEILLMFAATTLINAASMVNWLFPKQLIDRGFPGDPVLWVGVAGLIVLACAPDALAGSIGVLLANGIAFTVTRAVSVIWVNQRTSSDVRATVHSFLSQAECAGEIGSGFPLAGLAGIAGIPAALFAPAVFTASAGAAVAGRRSSRRPDAGRATIRAIGD
jgi:hypothetical protein